MAESLQTAPKRQLCNILSSPSTTLGSISAHKTVQYTILLGSSHGCYIWGESSGTELAPGQMPGKTCSRAPASSAAKSLVFRNACMQMNKNTYTCVYVYVNMNIYVYAYVEHTSKYSTSYTHVYMCTYIYIQMSTLYIALPCVAFPCTASCCIGPIVWYRVWYRAVLLRLLVLALPCVHTQ